MKKTGPDGSDPDDGVFLSDTLDCDNMDSSVDPVPKDTPLILGIPTSQYAGGINCGKDVLVQALIGSQAAGPVITAKASAGRSQ